MASSLISGVTSTGNKAPNFFFAIGVSAYLPVLVQSQLAQLWPERDRGHAVYGYCDNGNHKDPSVLVISHFELDEFLLAHSIFP